MDSKLKIISSYIEKLYLKSETVDDIYKLLIKYDKSNIDDILRLFYNDNNETIFVSEEKFISVISRIYKTIPNDIKCQELNSSKILKSIKKECKKNDRYNYEKMVYPLFLFVANLYYLLIENNCKCVYFFAREGQFMKKMFDEYQNQVIGPKIKTEYLYVSRASTFLSTLKSLKEETFSGLFLQYPNLSVYSFCKNLGFNDKEIKICTDSFKIDISETVNNFKENEIYQNLLKSSKFKEIYERKRTESRNAFMKYLDQFGILSEKDIYIVDVGWKGSIQNNIQKIIPNIKINGYYLGLVHYNEVQDYERKNAVLFEYTPKKISKNCYLYNNNRPFFEIFLDADHGSTINYNIKNGIVEPALNTLEKEQIMYENHIRKIQDNIFEKFCKLNKLLNYNFYDYKDVEKIFNRKFFQLIFKPSRRELTQYNQLYHFENFGLMTYSTFNNDEKLSIKNKIKAYIHFHDYIQNDESWQYLKLYNAHLQFGKIILIIYKWLRMKKNNII